MPRALDDRPPVSTSTTSTRRVMFGALGGVVIAVVAAMSGWAPGPVATVAAQGDQPPAEAFDAPPGSCLTWNSANSNDAHKVDCSAPHLFEVTGPADLSGNFAQGVPFPDDQTWRGLVEARCTQLTTRFLAGHFDPAGRYSLGALKPSKHGWESGDRAMRCGLQTSGPSGALYPVVGSASTHDQSAIHQPGSCLGIDGLGVGDPVGCDAPHAYEVVGNVNLGPQFRDGFPDPKQQDDFLTQACAKAAADFAGGPDKVGQSGLTVAWDDRKQDSWDAGSYQVDCFLGKRLPDAAGQGLAPVKGSVKDKVTIGQQAAPKATPAAPPGAPVPDATPITPPPAPGH